MEGAGFADTEGEVFAVELSGLDSAINSSREDLERKAGTIEATTVETAGTTAIGVFPTIVSSPKG